MKKATVYKMILISSFVAVAFIFPALAQTSNRDTQTLINRLNQLDNQIQTLSRFVYKGDIPPPNFDVAPVIDTQNLGVFEGRVSELEIQMRNLTGQIEKLQFDISRISDRLDSIEAQKAQSIQERTPFRENNLPPISSSSRQNVDAEVLDDFSFGASRQVLPTSGDATSNYEYAYGLLMEQKFPEAQKAFDSFISEFPNDRLINNARYWLAETYYVRGDFETSAIKFAEAYQKDMNGSKAPDNLLKLGMALGNLDKKEDACLSFGELEKRFPDAPASIKQRVAQQKSRLGC